MGKPPLTATLTWQGDLRFEAASGRQTLILDSDSTAGPSPLQTLAISSPAAWRSTSPTS